MITNLLFKDFLWQDKNNRLLLRLSLAAIAIQLVVFKYFYPNAGFIDGDSYVYLDSAFWNKGINTYMIGYSMFLRLFSVLTTSDFVLVVFQYLFIEFGALLFLFTLFYFFNPFKWIKYFLLAFVVINPLFLYMANYVSSDGFFLACSLIWFSTLIWIINRPSMKLIILSSVVLFICFTVRYNALFYPFIFFIALYLSKYEIKTKLLGIGLAIFSIGGFIIYNGSQYKQLTGKWQYSPFSGWQLANNAMYAYRYVDSADRKPVAKKFKALDNMVRKQFDTSRNPISHPENLLKASTVYMWTPTSALYRYRDLQFSHDSAAPELKKWASMGPFYSEYGLYIIGKYPRHFLEYFIWPNANKYYAPPVEFLENYNSGEDSVKQGAIVWFGYKTAKRHVRTKGLGVSILNYYPILTGTVNVIFLLSLLCLINLGFFRSKTPFQNSILLITLFWLGNAFFSIFSSSAALRFQAFPIVMITLSAFILIDLMYKTALHQEMKKNNSSKRNSDSEYEKSLSGLPVGY